MIRTFISEVIAAIRNAKWKILLVAAVLIALRCLWLWQPGRQVALHQQHFLQAVEDRNWTKLDGFLDASFRTQDGRDKTWAMQQSRMVLQQFLSLKINTPDSTIAVENDTGKVRTQIRIEGNGMDFAEMAKSAVNGSNDPWEFTWKHRSWKPWDWGLVSVDHPLIRHAPEIDQ